MRIIHHTAVQLYSPVWCSHIHRERNLLDNKDPGVCNMHHTSATLEHIIIGVVRQITVIILFWLCFQRLEHQRIFPTTEDVTQSFVSTNVSDEIQVDGARTDFRRNASSSSTMHTLLTCVYSCMHRIVRIYVATCNMKYEYKLYAYMQTVGSSFPCTHLTGGDLQVACALKITALFSLSFLNPCGELWVLFERCLEENFWALLVAKWPSLVGCS